MKLQVTLHGTKPMIQHNGRLANPLDPYARQLKELTSKRKKSDEDIDAILQIEARGGCWETTDGLLGVPTGAVWRAIYDAAKGFKLGADVKRYLSGDANTQPLVIDGTEVLCDEWVAVRENVDVRLVTVNARRTLRARPQVPLPWSTTHTFDLLDEFDAHLLAPVFDRAGRVGGIGEWRPTWGTFAADVEVVEQ